VTTATAVTATCPRCKGPLIASSAGPFCHKCWELAADIPAAKPRERHAQATETPLSAIRRVSFELPLPTRACSPNNSGQSSHWRVREGARAAYRAECANLLPTVDRAFTKARISVQFCLAPDPARYHPQDTQNAIASLKACVDSIVDRGWIPDDSARYLEWGTVELLSTAKEHQGRAEVLVTLEALPC
jgi:hypothetical protein